MSFSNRLKCKNEYELAKNEKEIKGKLSENRMKKNNFQGRERNIFIAQFWITELNKIRKTFIGVTKF